VELRVATTAKGARLVTLINLQTLSADITAKSLSVTGVNAQNKVYDGNTTAQLNAGSLVGLVLGDDVGLAQGSGRFADKNVGNGKAVTVSGFAINGTDAGNYDFTGQPTGLRADITPRPVAITVADGQREYGSENPTFYGMSTGFVPGDGITISYESLADLMTLPGFYGAGDPLAIQAVLSDPRNQLGNYRVSIEEGGLLIFGRPTAPGDGLHREQLWVLVDQNGVPLDQRNQAPVGYGYFNPEGDYQRIRHMLHLEDMQERGEREMTEEEREELEELHRALSLSAR